MSRGFVVLRSAYVWLRRPYVTEWYFGLPGDVSGFPGDVSVTRCAHESLDAAVSYAKQVAPILDDPEGLLDAEHRREQKGDSK